MTTFITTIVMIIIIVIIIVISEILIIMITTLMICACIIPPFNEGFRADIDWASTVEWKHIVPKSKIRNKQVSWNIDEWKLFLKWLLNIEELMYSKQFFMGNQLKNETMCIVLLWLNVKTDQVSYFKLRSSQHLYSCIVVSF